MSKERTEQKAKWPEKVSAKVALAAKDILTTPEKVRNRREFIAEMVFLGLGVGAVAVIYYPSWSRMIDQTINRPPEKKPLPDIVIDKGQFACFLNLCYFPYSGISKFSLSEENQKKIYESAPFPIDTSRKHFFIFGLETLEESEKKIMPIMPPYTNEFNRHYFMLLDPWANLENTSLNMNTECLMVLRGYQKYGDSYWPMVRAKTNDPEFNVWRREIENLLVKKKLPLMVEVISTEKRQDLPLI